MIQAKPINRHWVAGSFLLILLGSSLAAKAEPPPTCHCIKILDCDGFLTWAIDTSVAEPEPDTVNSVLQEVNLMYKNRCQDPRLLATMGRLLDRLGRYDEAVMNLQKYIDLGIDDAIVNQFARRCLTEAKSHAAAAPAPAPAPAPVFPVSASPQFPVPDDAKPRTELIPIYKRWWLWTSVGMAAISVISGIALGVYVSPPSWPNAPKLTPFQ